MFGLEVSIGEEAVDELYYYWRDVKGVKFVTEAFMPDSIECFLNIEEYGEVMLVVVNGVDISGVEL